MNSMRTAYLTIDDSPNELTASLVSYLAQKRIPAVFFCIGKSIEENASAAAGIVQAGFEIGNHSYSHPQFSDLSPDQCIEEIARTESIINATYQSAGIERKHKYFRFPYGNKGGPNKSRIQQYLRENEFHRFPSAQIEYPWYQENHLDTDFDVFWTFDCEDYRLLSNPPVFGMDDLLRHLDDPNPANGGSLVSGTGAEIILMHDFAQSHRRFPEYYKTILSKIEQKGIEFIKP